MMQVHTITTLEIPELALYRTMKRQEEHYRQGVFVAEGDKVVRRLLQSPIEVISVLMPKNRLESFRSELEGRPENLPVYIAEKSLLETLTGFPMYQGVLAVARVPAPLNFDAQLRQLRRPCLLAAVDGVSSSENMGVIIRNCGAFGVQWLLVGETCCSPFLRRSVRGSMGVIFQLPVAELKNLAATLHDLRTQGIQAIAAHPHANQRLLPEASLSSDCCLVFGSEGMGISPPVLEACRQAASVPMQNDVDSLNVGSASAVFLYEAWRQRRGSSS